MTLRRIIAIASLVSGLVSLYLYLQHLGLAGKLLCGGGPNGCERIQESVYGKFLGFDVALIGAIGYGLIFAVATMGGLDKHVDETWPTLLLMGLIYPAMLFTLRLKYYEFGVLHGFCPWCLVSALTITLCTVLITLDWKRVRRLETQGAAA